MIYMNKTLVTTVADEKDLIRARSIFLNKWPGFAILEETPHYAYPAEIAFHMTAETAKMGIAYIQPVVRGSM